MQLHPGCLLEPQKHAHRHVPNNAVVCRVRLGLSPEVASPFGPVGLLDLSHERLIVGMDHER